MIKPTTNQERATLANPRDTTQKPAQVEYEPLVKNSLRKTSPLFANSGYALTKPRLDVTNKLSMAQGQDHSYHQPEVKQQQDYFKAGNSNVPSFDSQFEPNQSAEVTYRYT